MTHVLPFKGPQTRARTVPRVLYIGPAADEICNIITNHIGRIEIAYEQEVQAAFAQMRRREFDVVMVDQRDDNLATRLILPVIQSIGYPVKPVVISALNDVSQYLAIPGVARVLSAPVKEAQFLRVLGLERRAAHEEVLQAPTAQPAKVIKTKSIVGKLSDRFMNLVSTLYKRSAFVLLLSLFIAFVFYGVLIAFFLLSAGWGAPLTLTRGHEMVSRVEREITEVKVALNQTEQRLSDASLARITAKQELQDAEGLVDYAKGTVKKELQSRKRQAKVLGQSIKRLAKVRGQLQAQVDGQGASADLVNLYKKRLINRSSYSAGALGLAQASQSLASVEIEIDQAQSQIEEFSSSEEMLLSLQDALTKGKSVMGVTASASDLLLLVKQSSDALSARSLAQSKLDSTADNALVLAKSIDVLQTQLAALETCAL
jgi:hypothetical protein